MFHSADEERLYELSRQLEGVLEEGESFAIRCENYSIDVVSLKSPELFQLRRSHEDLYGCLLDVSEDMKSATSKLGLWILLLTVGVLVGVQLSWFERMSFLPLRLRVLAENLHGYGFPVVFTITMYIFHMSLVEQVEAWRYQSQRSKVLRAMFESGMTRYRLISKIEGDPSLRRFAHHFKRDHGSGRLE